MQLTTRRKLKYQKNIMHFFAHRVCSAYSLLYVGRLVSGELGVSVLRTHGDDVAIGSVSMHLNRLAACSASAAEPLRIGTHHFTAPLHDTHR